jgi:predicted component of type VI protein secretion system
MSLKNDVELANTRAKLHRLEKRYEELRNDTSEDAHVRELTMRSLKGTINQFKEEIARYETCPVVRG